MNLNHKGTVLVEKEYEPLVVKTEDQPSELGHRKTSGHFMLSALGSAALVLGIVIFWGIRSVL